MQGVHPMTTDQNQHQGKLLGMLSNRKNEESVRKSVDSTIGILQANNQFNTVKALLSSCVASQDEKIKEVSNDVNLHLIEKIPINLKIRTQDKPAPLKISFSYFGAVQKSLKVYLSHDIKEPCQGYCMSSALNPTTI